MPHLVYRNVTEAFQEMVGAIVCRSLPTRKTTSRVGDVLTIDEPVIVTLLKPEERVLLNPARDANPFFHLFESLWMLAGSNRVEPLVYYNKRMSEFSDNGKTFWGAYGFRWRVQFGYDQIAAVVKELKARPDSRRAVIQIWDAHGIDHGDLGKGMLGGKDLPCNTQAAVAIRDGRLELTVFNRSNDLVWGMLGANAVHFSFLQEFIAESLHLPMGSMHLITNNLHVYTDRWEPEKWLAARVTEYPALTSVMIGGVDTTFTEECQAIVDVITPSHLELHDEFLRKTVQPMLMAFHYHKRRQYWDAWRMVDKVAGADWRLAAASWIDKRHKAWSVASHGPTSTH